MIVLLLCYVYDVPDVVAMLSRCCSDVVIVECLCWSDVIPKCVSSCA